MANPEKVILKIVSVKGTRAAGHREGQQFDLSEDFVLGFSGKTQTLCPHAFYAASPFWQTLQFGGELPWEEDKDKACSRLPRCL